MLTYSIDWAECNGKPKIRIRFHFLLLAGAILLLTNFFLWGNNIALKFSANHNTRFYRLNMCRFFDTTDSFRVISQ